MTLFRKFIAAMTTRPAFLDKSRKYQEQFEALPDFVQRALRSGSEIPPEAVQVMIESDDRFTRAAAEIAARKKTITVESNVVIDLD